MAGEELIHKDIIIQWLELASAAPYREEYLHSLNGVREESWGTELERKEMWVKFGEFLLEKVTNADGTQKLLTDVYPDPDRALSDFVKKHSVAPDDFIILAGPAVDTPEEVICTQQTLNKIRRSDWITDASPNFLVNTQDVINHTGANLEKVNNKAEMEDWFSEFNDYLEAATENFGPDFGFEANVSEWDFEDTPRTVDENLKYQEMWLTFKSSLAKNLKPGALKPSASARSFFMARQRYLAGMYNKSDSDSFDKFRDAVFANKDNPSPSNPIGFKTVITLMFLPEDDFNCSQPTIFSNGYNNLFVSEPHDKKWGGRACRLQIEGCMHKKCQCGGVGLPEIVASIYELLKNTRLRIHDIALIQNKHLNRYTVPHPNLIAEKRGLTL